MPVDVLIPISTQSLRGLLAMQSELCALTGRPLTPDNVRMDHVTPVSKGGLNSMDNVQLIVDEANSAKGSMSQEQFIRLCHDVARHNPL